MMLWLGIFGQNSWRAWLMSEKMLRMNNILFWNFISTIFSFYILNWHRKKNITSFRKKEGGIQKFCGWIRHILLHGRGNWSTAVVKWGFNYTFYMRENVFMILFWRILPKYSRRRMLILNILKRNLNRVKYSTMTWERWVN